MNDFYWIKFIHVSCALASICGFALRGYWVLSGNSLRDHRLTKILPHTIDTVLLGSAIAMLVMWQVSPFELPWVTAKLLALLLYIGLGLALMRFARTGTARGIAYIAALVTAGYIISVAYTKSALGVLSLLGG